MRGAALAIALAWAPAAGAQVTWDEAWPRFGQPEQATTVALIGTLVGLNLAHPLPEARWTGPFLVDGPVRRGLVAKTRGGREGAALASDVLLWTSVAWPLTDAAVAASYGEASRGAGGQIALISVQSLLVAAAGNRLVSFATARARPYNLGCERDPEYSPECGSSDRNRSFFSGHTAIAFAGAGLVCAQHGAMDLYGGAWDPLACGVAMGAATSVGVLRIVSDRHHLSDVFVGAAWGFAAGWVLPKALHYGFGQREAEPVEGLERRARVIRFTVAF